MAKYGKKTEEKVEEVMKKFKKGELKSGRSDHTVTSREQAIAIALSGARKEGNKLPPKEKKELK